MYGDPAAVDAFQMTPALSLVLPALVSEVTGR
jgi:hypothetical protein